MNINTIENATNEQTTSILAQTSFSKDRIFDYDATWKLARQGDENAINAIKGEFRARLNNIQRKINAFKPDNGYQHKLNKSNIRQSANNYRSMLKMLNQIGKELPLRELNKIKNNRVLMQPYFGEFTALDLQMFLIGATKNGSASRYRGIANFPMQDYGTFEIAEEGILLSLNGEQLLLSTDEAHALIANALKATKVAHDDAALLKKGDQLTPEAIEVLKEELCHFQHVYYTQSGVFASSGGTASPDGVTLVLKEGTEFLTKDGQPKMLGGKTRISMKYKTYAALIHPVAEQRGIDTTGKYQWHHQVADMMFGKKTNQLPQTGTEMNQYLDLCYAMIHGHDDTFSWKTEEEQAALFQPGRYLSIRHFTCIQDMFDKYEECMAAFAQDQIERAEKAKAQREARVTKQQPVEDLLTTEDENPFED